MSGDLQPPFRILLATDDSEPARQAEAWVARLRWSRPYVVDVLCVAGHGIGDAMTALDRLSEPLRDQADAFAIEVDIGYPLEGALRAAEELAADLVIVARPPRRRGQDPFAEKVARYASTSVLVVPRT